MLLNKVCKAKGDCLFCVIIEVGHLDLGQTKLEDHYFTIALIGMSIVPEVRFAPYTKAVKLFLREVFKLE